ASRWARASSLWNAPRSRWRWSPTSSSAPGRCCAPPRAAPRIRPDRKRRMRNGPGCGVLHSARGGIRNNPRPGPLAHDAPRRRAPSVVAVDLGLQVVLLADPLDQRQLGFQPVDVFFLGLEDVGEQPPADEIADLLAMDDRLLERGDGFHLQREVALEHFLRVFADLQLAQRLEIR